jgi:hypothetical protein
MRDSSIKMNMNGSHHSFFRAPGVTARLTAARRPM